MKESWFKTDDVVVNSMWGFDYCFCGADCTNTECGRNYGSKSYEAMRKSEPVYSCSDFSTHCDDYKKEVAE